MYHWQRRCSLIFKEHPKVKFDIYRTIYVPTLTPGTGIITKSELKYFYTAFMDVGRLGEQRLDEITNNAYGAMTSVSNPNRIRSHNPHCPKRRRHQRVTIFFWYIIPKMYPNDHKYTYHMAMNLPQGHRLSLCMLICRGSTYIGLGVFWFFYREARESLLVALISPM
jgi:hypothetical protein